MIRRILLAILLAILLMPSVGTTAEHPNVLFLICDDLNCDLGCYGHPLVSTPNIDALAADGVRFDKAYCQYPLCGPSRASLMTGLYPDQTLVRRNSVYIREHLPDVLSLPQMFRTAGYKATRIGKIFHYNVPRHIGTSGHDDPYSWDNTINPEGRDVFDEDKIFSLVPGSFGGTLSWLAADGTDEEQTDGIAATEADRVLAELASSRRAFFLAVGLYRPHTPYVAPKKYFDLYPEERISIPTIPDGYLKTLPKPARDSVSRKKVQRNLKPELARKAIQAYYASISFADAQVGRILKSLTKHGLAKNTIVVFTSDHGYHMGEHGHYQKTTLFENATRVPLVMRGPGITAKGTTAKSLAEMVDFYPTLADLCGLNQPEFLAGTSLIAALQDASATPRTEALSQYNNGYSLRTDRFRFTMWGHEGNEGMELYDHHSDPEELRNLSSDPQVADIVTSLKSKLQKAIRTAQAPPTGLTQNTFENQRKESRPDFSKRLIAR